MTLIAKAVEDSWAEAMAELNSVLQARQVHPTRAVVLVPYAQLMQQARLAWAAHAQAVGIASAFVPRFETTMNWATALKDGAPADAGSPEDIRMDAALDALTATSLLKRAGLGAQHHMLSGRLVEAAWSLARLAAAQPPSTRLAWGTLKSQQLGAGIESPALVFELAIARIALAWAAASSYPSDVLFTAEPDLLVVLNGFQTEPLTEALKQHLGRRCVTIQLKTPLEQGAFSLHTAQDLEDEAHLAAACVLAHLVAGRSPVALVAQDRVLTRRVSAMLWGQGVASRDETGWKLSTTRAAATLMGLLRIAAWDASTDSVLDWLKNAPAFDEADVARAEASLRKLGIRYWRFVPGQLTEIEAIASKVDAIRQALQAARPLADWLTALQAALETSGQWSGLATDAAGMQVLAALHMTDESSPTIDAPSDALSATHFNPNLSLQDFTAWASQALEADSFAPAHPPVAQVVILPLSQLLGRPMQAVVLPGCDEARLPVSPEPPGQWSATQRVLLGLPTRQQLADDQCAAWRYALTAPRLDLLWRLSEGGESLMPSGFVQELLLTQQLDISSDPRTQRTLAVQPTLQPAPTAQALAITQLSASAYEDLRRCPYRFFALRQLKLQEADELESELGKRDFGNWLHLVLYNFQNSLKITKNEPIQVSNQPLDQQIHARAAMINIAADEATKTLGLSQEEFLPFAAIWPRVRDGYLDWLAAHEASGASYAEGEVWKRMPLGSLELVGKIDRIDQLADGSKLVMDYKTEPASTTKDRIKAAGEDTQLAFYAALLDEDTLAAAYVNLGEKEATKTYAQPEIVDLRDDLIGGILSDMARIFEGAPLLALGEGKACEYCAARGLCRKDFWS